jgi:adenylate cyclase
MDEFSELLQKFEVPEIKTVTIDDKPSILIVDDDESIRNGLTNALSYRYIIKTAENGRNGIEVLSKSIYCVILDVKMKELNGFSTYPMLKEKCPDVPIIFFTAFQSEHDLQEVINKYKPEGYVEKGRDISFLENLIENAVNKYKLILENEEYKNNLEKKVEERTMELENEKEKVIIAQNILSKYVPTQLVDKIINGKSDVIHKYKRQKLTLFFSDIVNFTNMTDSMEPEDLADIINAYLAEMFMIINKHHGTLSQIIGDGLYVFFGAPDFTDDMDHAIRCANMAIDMQIKMRELNKRWFSEGLELYIKIRCGINTGIVNVGSFGTNERREYVAMGMPVNIASRLESAAEPENIFLSHSTWGLINKAIICEEVGHLDVKGLSRAVKAYRISIEEYL